MNKISKIYSKLLGVVAIAIASIICIIAIPHSAYADDVLTIALTSNPTSGTSNNPKSLSLSTDIVYSIEIANNGTDTVENVVVNDDIPSELHIADSSLSYYVNGDTSNIQPLSDDAGIVYMADGNSITFNIASIGAGESVTLYIPTVVNSTDEGEVLFENRAYISSYNGTDTDIQSTGTYHTYTGGVSTTLPELKGSGNLPFIILGIAIMAAAAILTIVTFRRRHRKR